MPIPIRHNTPGNARALPARTVPRMSIMPDIAPAPALSDTTLADMARAVWHLDCARKMLTLAVTAPGARYAGYMLDCLLDQLADYSRVDRLDIPEGE
jgi:hypothetical protein